MNRNETHLKERSAINCDERVDILFRTNLPLAKAIALGFCKPGEAVENSEAYSSALMGLFKAARTYDETIGAFSTWATKIIRRTIYGDYRVRNRSVPTVNMVSENELVEVAGFDLGPDWPRDKLYEWLQPDTTDNCMVSRNKRIALLVLNNNSYAEIGRILNLSREGVRQNLVRCILHLKEMHKEEIENTIFKWPGKE